MHALVANRRHVEMNLDITIVLSIQPTAMLIASARDAPGTLHGGGVPWNC